MIYLRSTIFNILNYSTLLIGVITSSIISAFMPQKWTIAMWNYGFQRLGRFYLKAICGLDIEIRGAENIKQSGVIYACKHQSAVETYFLTTYLKTATFVMKKELTYIPLFGWAFYFYGMIPIDRSSGSAAMKKMLRETKKALSEGRSVIVFPEGTRTKPGQEPQYKPGLAFLYQNLNVPVIPVASNTGFFWKKRSFLRQPGKIIFDFMPAIEPNVYKREFMQVVQEKIETKCDELNVETIKNYPSVKEALICQKK